MSNNGIPQIHLIPFDIGCVFVDLLSADNSKSLLFAEKFTQELSNFYKENLLIKVNQNLKITHKGKTVIKYDFLNSKLAENTICYVQLMEDLYCYVLASGVGMFVLMDFKGEALLTVDKEIGTYSVALQANYQKKITQSSILNKRIGGAIFLEKEKTMLEFRKACWKIVSDASAKKEIVLVRKYSGNLNYKASGLSYVLSILLLNKDTIGENEIKHLMYSSIFSNVIEQENWENINEEIKKPTTIKPNVVISGDNKLYFSWAGVGIKLSNNINSYSDIIKSCELCAVIKAEIYVQSRWFIADNSMDNVNRNMTCSMENLQRIESIMELSQAELDNEISANMNTLYKNVLEQIIQTSEVRKLYKSVVNQIHTQKKIKEAQYLDKKSKNRLMVNIFLAVFTASSLFKTVNELINNKFDWKNIILFAVMMVIAIGTVVFEFKNK